MAVTDVQTALFLRGLPFFKGMAEKDILALFESANSKVHSKHKTLFLLGENTDRFFIILNGWVKIFRSTPDGEESVLAVYTRGDVFGEAAIFENASYTSSATIAEDADILEIPAKVIREIADQNSDILTRILSSMAKEMRTLQMEKEHLSIMSAPQRVGCLLLQLASGMMGKGGIFPFPYDKSLAAARLGMKPETFSRALAQLKPLGVEVKGAEIQINSFNCLIQYVCGTCSSLPGECRGSRDTDRGHACLSGQKCG